MEYFSACQSWTIITNNEDVTCGMCTPFFVVFSTLKLKFIEYNLPINTFSFLYIIQKEASGTNIANKVSNATIVSNAEKVVGSMSVMCIANFSKNAFLYKTTSSDIAHCHNSLC